MKIKLNKAKSERFDLLVQQLVEQGHDIYLDQEQSKVTIFLNKTESSWSLVFSADGTWALE
jgi:hypothetical protein